MDTGYSYEHIFVVISSGDSSVLSCGAPKLAAQAMSLSRSANQSALFNMKPLPLATFSVLRSSSETLHPFRLTSEATARQAFQSLAISQTGGSCALRSGNPLRTDASIMMSTQGHLPRERAAKWRVARNISLEDSRSLCESRSMVWCRSRSIAVCLDRRHLDPDLDRSWKSTMTLPVLLLLMFILIDKLISAFAVGKDAIKQLDR
jgi:hypothetical protein